MYKILNFIFISPSLPAFLYQFEQNRKYYFQFNKQTKNVSIKHKLAEKF